MFYARLDEEWLGLEAIRLPFRPEIYLVPLLGHRRGDCGVAIQADEGWLLHSADALQLNVEDDVTPAWLSRMVLSPQGPRLQAFGQDHPEVRLLVVHMRPEFIQARPVWRRPSASGRAG